MAGSRILPAICSAARFPISAGICRGQSAQGKRYLRRLVRIGQQLARGSAGAARSEFPGRPVSGRLRSASRLVPAFAVAVIGRDGQAAVQAGAHARLRRQTRRHEGLQERQGIRHRHAGDQPPRGGSAAAVVLQRRLSERHPRFAGRPSRNSATSTAKSATRCAI